MSATYTQTDSSPEVRPAGWAELALAVLRSVRDHAPYMKEEDRDDFQQEMDEILQTLDQSPPAAPLQASAARLTEKLPQYFSQTQNEVDRLLAELRKLASMLMESLTLVEQADQSIGSSLSEIQQIVHEARSPGKLAVAKIHLVQVLERLRTERDKRKEASSELLTTLQKKAQALELAPRMAALSGTSPSLPTVSGSGPSDSITGLYGRQAGEMFLTSLSGKAKATTYLVAFYIQRMELINSRFGDRMSTDVLCYCAQHFARLLQPSDQLFRWGGPAFVAVLSRGRSLSDVRQEVNSFCRTRMTFETADNLVLLPLAILTQVWPARKSNAAELIRNIEPFFSLPSTSTIADASDGPWKAETGDEDFNGEL